MSSTVLFHFGYTWPEELARFDANPDGSDLAESSCVFFIETDTEERALARGEDVAGEFVRVLFTGRAYPWAELQFAAWIERDPEITRWAREEGAPLLGFHDDTKSFAMLLARWDTEATSRRVSTVL